MIIYSELADNIIFIKATGLWHSAEREVTKCHFEGEVGSAATASRSGNN